MDFSKFLRMAALGGTVSLAAFAVTSAQASSIAASFLPGIETENPSVSVAGPAPAAAPIELASFGPNAGGAVKDSVRILRGSIESNLPVTDIALRHTDKKFFSRNPISFKQVPPTVETDNDVALTSVTFAWSGERQPFDEVVAIIDLSDQRMRVYVEGVEKHVWKVSSGARGYGTPTGEWRPYRMHTLWHSRKYNMAPMPHSVFFHGGYAVHATGAIGRLGRPASHGCIRLHPSNAKQFFRLVSQYKKAGTIVRIVR
ncbi:L,D-transpeptidase [Tepidamorphus sp. 3E244]|uniref:L,D-transpeptidase n=1 Tax=Tepidamorphus sp. 3E244 TaxID=3385498 RepID=UPI0038FC8F75